MVVVVASSEAALLRVTDLLGLEAGVLLSVEAISFLISTCLSSFKALTLTLVRGITTVGLVLQGNVCL